MPNSDKVIGSAIFILYVSDQHESTAFYTKVLDVMPSLYVEGMTEFNLKSGCSLGLMPAKGIKRLLGKALPDPQSGAGIPRTEVYLRVNEPDEYHQRAVAMGARELSPLGMRDWGDVAAYSLDRDGHVLVFAKSM